MVSDIAYEIVKLTEILEAEEDKQKEQKENEKRKIYMIKNLVELNVSFLVSDENEVHEDDFNGDDDFDYIIEKFTKYNDEIYWVLRHNTTDDVLKVINITKNPNILQHICKTANAHYLYEERHGYRMNFNFRESCIFNGTKMMGYDCTGVSLYYPPDAEVHEMLKEAFDVIRDFEIV